MSNNTQTLYQHGTLALLVPGLLAGTQTIGELMQHGDTGIGTLTGLDGELIMRADQVYQVNADGHVRIVGPEEQVPFANVHYQDDRAVGKITDQNFDGIKATILQAMGTSNVFYAVRLVGEFDQVQTRAVRGTQQPPFGTLAETAKAQSVFNAADIAGTLSGYYSPAIYGGATSPGFHLHFLDDEPTFGGHVLDAKVRRATLYLQEFTDLQLHLPTGNEQFRQEQFNTDEVLRDINQAEN
ncbi:acetolactate decarboxylase [Lacticaseibacillus pantheris]|uniref:acetolactate decarboxylase n=1 Tax=Lacticaseibacillus pantheris TaxID=171523 RepID=UPI00265A4E75|nr:acetolactate decarboxylase [Lacticaseibacillus pantheris]WKF84433.1 acetolactate decarboxylase [Lacticaseibacillus pantheris]